MVIYGSNDRNDNDNDPKNQACYNSGFNDGQQNHLYNQSEFTQCGINNRAYHEGFLSGCISGPGQNYFACQKLTTSPSGGGAATTNN